MPEKEPKDIARKVRQLWADKISAVFNYSTGQFSSEHFFTHKRVRITKKQYYPRIRRLYQFDLIEKSDGMYVITNIGRMILKTQVQMVEELSDTIAISRSNKLNSRENIKAYNVQK